MSTPAAEPTLAGLTLAWITQLAEVVRREGYALRAGQGPWIEAQSVNNGLWYPLTLEGRKEGDVLFRTVADRDAVLAEIRRRAADSFFPPETRSRATAILNTMSAIAHR